MSTYGVTDQGFVIKPPEDIQAAIEGRLKASFGASINLNPDSNFGQITGLVTEVASEIWDLALGVYNAFYSDTAGGVQLDNVMGLTGTLREAPTYTRVMANLTGTPATVVPATTIFSTASGAKFSPVDDVVLDGSGNATGVDCKAITAGPLACLSGALTGIDTPVAGLSTVTNPLDAYLIGTFLEADPDARIRREEEIRATGNAAVLAIRSKVLEVDLVTDCYVFQNTSDAVDGNGLPAHSTETVVNGGADADIAEAIFESVAAGIRTYGTTTVPVTDSQGIVESIQFTRPSLLAIYVTVNLVRDGNWNPATGVAAVKQAILDYASANLHVGDDVITRKLDIPVFSVSGVADITSLFIGLAPAPASSTNIPVTLHQLAQFDSSRITVNVS
jgi:hypothetical protein